MKTELPESEQRELPVKSSGRFSYKLTLIRISPPNTQSLQGLCGGTKGAYTPFLVSNPKEEKRWTVPVRILNKVAAIFA